MLKRLIPPFMARLFALFADSSSIILGTYPFVPTGSTISFISHKNNYYHVGVVIYDGVTVHYCDVVVNYTDGAVVSLFRIQGYSPDCDAEV